MIFIHIVKFLKPRHIFLLYNSITHCVWIIVHDSYYLYNFAEKQERGVHSRQVDTNVVALTFDTLSGPAGVHTGDVVVCNNEECTAVLSHLSKVSGGSDSYQKVHTCSASI